MKYEKKKQQNRKHNDEQNCLNVETKREKSKNQPHSSSSYRFLYTIAYFLLIIHITNNTLNANIFIFSEHTDNMLCIVSNSCYARNANFKQTKQSTMTDRDNNI